MAPDRVVTSNWRLAVEKILQRGRPLLRVRLQTTSPWTSRRRDAEAKLSHEKFLSNFGTRKKKQFRKREPKIDAAIDIKLFDQNLFRISA